MNSTNKVVPFRRPSRRNGSSGAIDRAEETRTKRHLWIHAMLFTAVALIVYTAAVLAVPGEEVETLWFVWLIFVVAVSKLLLANGFIFAAIGADKRESARRTTKLGPLPFRSGHRHQRFQAAPRFPRR